MLTIFICFPPTPNSFSEEAALEISNTSVIAFEQLAGLGLIESRGENRYSLHQTIFDFAKESLETNLYFTRLVEYYSLVYQTECKELP